MPVLLFTGDTPEIRNMSMELIRQWYNGAKDYLAGVALYEVYGGDTGLIRLMKKGETSFTREKLTEELLCIFYGEQPPVQPNEGDAAPYELLNLNAPKDPVLLELYLRKVELHKAKDILRHALAGMTSDTDRGAAAHQILRMRAEISDIWAKEAHYKEHGRLPSSTVGVTDPEKLKQRRRTVNDNIRRLRMLLKKEPDNAGYQKSFAKFQAEYSYLKALIKKYGKAAQ